MVAYICISKATKLRLTEKQMATLLNIQSELNTIYNSISSKCGISNEEVKECVTIREAKIADVIVYSVDFHKMNYTTKYIIYHPEKAIVCEKSQIKQFNDLVFSFPIN